MDEIRFNIDKMTIGDYATLIQATQTGNMHSLLGVINTCASRSIWDVPFAEMSALCLRFSEAVKVYFQAKKDVGVDDARRMIEKLFGDTPPNA